MTDRAITSLHTKPKVLYLQDGKISTAPLRPGKLLRVITVLEPEDFALDREPPLYKSTADIAGFFVLAGERVEVGECPSCGETVDSNEIRHPPGLTPVHRCA